MFSKPLSHIEESDVQALVDNGQKESVALEFKQELSGSDREKKELPKDISAIANTEGDLLFLELERMMEGLLKLLVHPS
jgi:predicted HTH transcriptional regulator